MSKYKIYSLIAGLLFTVSYAPTSTAQTSSPPKQVNPIKRSAPTMPSGVQESGYCCISYNVSAKGKPVDIVAPYCTSPVFQKSAVKAVKKWRYKKSKEIKSDYLYENYSTKVTFSTFDRSNPDHPAPSASGYMSKRDPNVSIPPRPKDINQYFKWQRKYFDTDINCNRGSIS